MSFNQQQRKTFLDPSVCKNALVWNCPSQMVLDTRKTQPAFACKLDHDPYYKTQFRDAIEQYRQQRAKAEPDWNSAELIDGDPWGFTFELFCAIEDEIEGIETHRDRNLKRPDVFNHQEVKVNDDNYLVIDNQIKELYIEADKMLDPSCLEVEPPQLVHILTTIQNLEETRHQILCQLVKEQCQVITHYFTRRREVLNELLDRRIIAPDWQEHSIKQYEQRNTMNDEQQHHHHGDDNTNNQRRDAEEELKQIEDPMSHFSPERPAKTREEVKILLLQRVPLPPVVIDIQPFTDIRLDYYNPPDNFISKDLPGLTQEVMSRVRSYKLQICDTCCGLLNLQDELQRLSLHIRGKVHYTYCLLRQQHHLYKFRIRPLPAQHTNPNLIHPWAKWYKHYIPRSEYEIQGGIKQRHLCQYQDDLAEFLDVELGVDCCSANATTIVANNSNIMYTNYIDPQNVLLPIKTDLLGPQYAAQIHGNPNRYDQDYNNHKRYEDGGFRQDYHVTESEAFSRSFRGRRGPPVDDKMRQRDRDYDKSRGGRGYY